MSTELPAAPAGAGVVDLRSDTVTRPTDAMRRAMAEAEVGDDVFGDDPTVIRLQEEAAALLGYQSALFCTSGTQSNLVALMTHCGRGDEVILGQQAHTYRYEGGGAAVLGSIQPQPVEHAADGTLPLAAIEAAIKADDPHFARTRLLALENTLGGRVLPPAYCAAATGLAHGRGLATHLDGARLMNAAVALGLPARELARGFDTLSLCLSKGLGAPAGTVLLGSAEFIARARRPRKMLGGGLRQVGVLAAAGRHALQHHVARLAQDHERARRLAEGLAAIDGPAAVVAHTNMVFFDLDAGHVAPLAAWLRERGVIALTGRRVRLVTHLDVDDAGIERALSAFRAYFAAHPGPLPG